MIKTKTLKPFFFTSDLELQNTQGAWYAMWINPKSLHISYQFRHSEIYTRGGYGHLHWKNMPVTIKMSGLSGWVFGGEVEEQQFQPFKKRFSTLRSDQQPGFTDIQDPDFQTALSRGRPFSKELGLQGNLAALGKLNESVKTSAINDPRLFVNRLKRVALQNKFYFNYQSKIHRFNTRYMIIHTKRYPDGKEVSGFFTDFNIDEDAEDTQRVEYSCTFTATTGLEPETDDDVEKSLLERFVRK